MRKRHTPPLTEMQVRGEFDFGADRRYHVVTASFCPVADAAGTPIYASMYDGTFAYQAIGARAQASTGTPEYYGAELHCAAYQPTLAQLEQIIKLMRRLDRALPVVPRETFVDFLCRVAALLNVVRYRVTNREGVRHGCADSVVTLRECLTAICEDGLRFVSYSR